MRRLVIQALLLLRAALFVLSLALLLAGLWSLGGCANLHHECILR
jgi:hypothetical protein